MSTSITLLMMGVGLAILYLAKLNSPVWELVKASMFMLLATSLMHVLPVGFLQDWSRLAVGKTTVTPSVVTDLCFLLVFAIVVGRMPFVKPGTTVGMIVMGALLVIGGTFSVGAAGWSELSQGIGECVMAIAKVTGAFITALTAGLVHIS